MCCAYQGQHVDRPMLRTTCDPQSAKAKILWTAAAKMFRTSIVPVFPSHTKALSNLDTNHIQSLRYLCLYLLSFENNFQSKLCQWVHHGPGSLSAALGFGQQLLETHFQTNIKQTYILALFGNLNLHNFSIATFLRVRLQGVSIAHSPQIRAKVTLETVPQLRQLRIWLMPFQVRWALSPRIHVNPCKARG